MTNVPASSNPWDWLQTHDVERFGAAILDPVERKRWCKATLIGGLPYLWRYKAAALLEFVYGKMSLKPDAKVLLIGESIPSCGFEDDIRAAIGTGGEILTFDIIERARTTTAAGTRGRGGRIGTWQYDYTHGLPDEHYDCVAVLQAVQHCDDWPETALDMARVLKSGAPIVLTEIGLGPQQRQVAHLDLHVEYWMDKLYAGTGMSGPEDASYYSPGDLLTAFAGMLEATGSFSWRGADVVWGTKRVS